MDSSTTPVSNPMSMAKMSLLSLVLTVATKRTRAMSGKSRPWNLGDIRPA